MALITKTQIRALCGIGTDIVDDTKLDNIITEVENKTLNYFGVNPTPKKMIEILDGNNKNTIMINKPYILKLLELKVSDNSIDLSNVTINIKSGIITIDNTKNPYIFLPYKNGIKLKYLSGFMDKDTTSITEIDTGVSAGSSVEIVVDDESIFEEDDWVLIEGTDGKREVAQITAVSRDNSSITVDLLVQDHEEESIVIKMKTDDSYIQFLLYETALSTSITAVGGSYNFATGYTFPEYSVQKGVPYSHFVKAINDLEKQRDIVKNKLFSKINVMA